MVKWDDRKKQVLQAMLKDGFDIGAIAERLSVPAETVDDMIYRLRSQGSAPKPVSSGATWTRERVELLKELWAERLTCSQIADRLGGVTRNAVIGKVTRLKLPLRGTRGHRQGEQRRTYTMSAARKLADARRRKAAFADKFWQWRQRVAPSFEAKQEPLPPVWPGDVGRIPFAETTNEHCMFIPGDPKVDSRVCGLPRMPHVAGRPLLPYCEVHAERCLNIPKPRRHYPHEINGEVIHNLLPAPAVKESVEA